MPPAMTWRHPQEGAAGWAMSRQEEESGPEAVWLTCAQTLPMSSSVRR